MLGVMTEEQYTRSWLQNPEGTSLQQLSIGQACMGDCERLWFIQILGIANGQPHLSVTQDDPNKSCGGAFKAFSQLVLMIVQKKIVGMRFH